MTQKPTPPLPPVTEHDLAQRSHLLLQTSRGWVWRCAVCLQPASAQQPDGLYTCARHDASGPATTPSDPPDAGPSKAQFYSIRAHDLVDQLVAAYQKQKLDPDHTDADMLSLRASLQQMRELHPSVAALDLPLQHLQDALAHLAAQPVVDAGNVTAGRLLSQLELAEDWTAAGRCVRHLLREVEAFQQRIEARHVQLIVLAKVRSETRLKLKATQDLSVFALLLTRLKDILQQQLTPAELTAFYTWLRAEFDELDRRRAATGAARHVHA